jgi:uncharacterized membrane-anchored protein
MRVSGDDDFGQLAAERGGTGEVGTWNAPAERIIAWLGSRTKMVLAAGICLQLAILVSIIAFRVMLLSTGETVLVRVVPVDPRDLMRGDYVVLSYEFSRIPPEGISGLGRLEYDKQREWLGKTVYVELLPDEDGRHWRAGVFRLVPPTSGKYIRGTIGRGQRIEYGIESYYVQEGEGRRYEQAVGDRKLSAEIAIGANGEAALRKLVIDSAPGTPDAAPQSGVRPSE